MPRRLIVSNLMSIDGFFEDAKKTLDWVVVEDEFFHYARRLLGEVDMILFGRKTYEHMAAHWPTAPSGAITERMNNLAKVVFSESLSDVAWNNSTLVRGKASDAIRKLKAAEGRDMVIFGSARLASSLLEERLVDEYRLVLNPVLLGAGTPLFAPQSSRIKMRLVNFRRFASGVVVLYYRPTDDKPA